MPIGLLLTRILSVAIVVCSPFAGAQSCADQIRDAAPYQPSSVVSARTLLIPTKAWRHYQRARVAIERNQSAIADQESTRALALAPRFAEVYLLRAVQQLHQGRIEAALANVSIARGIDAELPWSTVVLASALNQLHRFDDAAGELEHAKGVEAASWQVLYEQARAEIGRHHTAAALHWSGLAVAAAPPGCTEARLVHANALHLAGRQAELVTELETYLAQDRLGVHHAEVLQALETARHQTLASDAGLVAMKDDGPGQR